MKINSPRPKSCICEWFLLKSINQKSNLCKFTQSNEISKTDKIWRKTFYTGWVTGRECTFCNTTKSTIDDDIEKFKMLR